MKSERRSPAITDGKQWNQLEFHLSKGDKMKSQQQGSHSSVTMRFALTFPPCKDQALTALRSVGFSLELRYVRCKVWVEQFGNSRHLHCQDSFCVALLTKRSKSMTRWQTLDLASQHLGEMHNTRSTLRWLNELATVSVSAATVSERSVCPRISRKGGWIMKDYDIPSRLCLSSLQTSLWVLCLLEICPYKPRGLSLLGQSVVG